MTLDDVRQLDKATLTPAEAAAVLGVSPQLLRIQARQQPEKLGFPVTVIGRRVLIPRLAFLRVMEDAQHGADATL